MQCEIFNLIFDYGVKIEVFVKCINKVQLMEVKRVGLFIIYYEVLNFYLLFLLFYFDNCYIVLEGNVNLKVQLNLIYVDFIWGLFDDLLEDVNYEMCVRKDDNVIVLWELVGFRNSVLRKINYMGRVDIFFVDVCVINNGGF